jgi:peptidoglycan/LPS O-acetylase OafA/YrhL
MGRLKRLDGVRGLLAVYVMLGHALPLTIAPGWAQALVRHGEAAVDLFFALSGLVIAFSLARFSGFFRPFIAARMRRLLPAYLPVLAASIALGMLGDPLRGLPWAGAPARDILSPALPAPLWPHILAHVALLHGIIPQPVLPYAYVTLLGPAWSLSTEWQFYLLIGLVAPRHMGRFAIALLAAGAIWHALPFGPLFGRAFLPDAAPYFALGLASAAWLSGQRRALLPCIAGAWAIGLAAGPGKSFTPLIWAILFLTQTESWGAPLQARWLQFLGAISYPLYLVNEPVQRALALILAPAMQGHPLLFSAFFLPNSLAISLALATLLHYWVERPFMHQGKKLLLPVIAPPLQQ